MKLFIAVTLSLCGLIAGTMLAADTNGQGHSPGRFNGAVDIRSTPLRTVALTPYGTFPMTVEMWVKLSSEKKARFNLLASNATEGAAGHWEIYTTPLDGLLSAELSGLRPKTIPSFVRLTDDKWHFVAMTCDGQRVALYVDGRQVANHRVARATRPNPTAEDGELRLGTEKKYEAEKGNISLVDELRISSTVRPLENVLPAQPLSADEHTVGLWRFDERSGTTRIDESRHRNALAYSPGIAAAWTPRSSTRPDAEPWERETDADWQDGSFNQMDTGSFRGISMSTPSTLGRSEGPYAPKGLALRLGPKGEASVLFDRGLVQMSAGWRDGFVRVPERRFGLIGQPEVVGTMVFSTPSRPGWAPPSPPSDVAETSPSKWSPLPSAWASYQGIYRHGNRSIVHYTVGGSRVLEMPWVERRGELLAITRTIQIEGRDQGLQMNVLEAPPEAALTRTSASSNAVPPRRGEQHEHQVPPPPVHSRNAVSTPKNVAANELGEGRGRGQAQPSSVNPETGPEASSQEAPASGPSVTLLDWPAGDQQHMAVALVTAGDQMTLRAVDRQVVLDVAPGAGVLRGKLYYWRGDAKDLAAFTHLVRSHGPPRPLETLTSGGPARWTDEIKTAVEVDPSPGPFAVDTFTLPEENPYGSIFRVTGLGFLPNGEIAICTIYGDVWVVAPAGHGQQLRWQRFATGLYQPFGIAIKDDKIHVLERGQITCLHDLNDDGEADYHENVYHRWQTTGAGHAYDTALKRAPDGSFFFFKGQAGSPHGNESGCLLRVLPDASGHEIFSTGFRHPIGLGMSPTGVVTGTDQQGNWIPATRIDRYRRGGFYGDMRTHHRPARPETYDRPICWLPRNVDNSAGGQVWIPEGRWGPLSGGVLHLSWGRCWLYLLLHEEVKGQVQGGVVRLPCEKLASGPLTGAFSPHDGHLYIAGMHGWQTAAERIGCLARVRYTGAKVYLPTGIRARSDGLHLRFSQPLDPEVAADLNRYTVQQWSYRYSGSYGSDHWSVAEPDRMGHDTVKLEGVSLPDDGHEVHLHIPGLQPVMQMRVAYRLQAADGTPVTGEIHNTIHNLGATD